MGDLVLASGLLLLVGTGLAWVGYRAGKQSTLAALTLSVPVAVLIAAYIVLFRDHPLLVWLVPTTALPVLGNPLPPLGMALAGILLGQTKLPRWRRCVLVLPVLVFAWEGPVRLITNVPPDTTPRWSDGVALQSTRSTCTAAATATLLTHHGIDADETTMARICLTDARGTSLLGMHRGLRIMTRDSGYRPTVDRRTLDELQKDIGRLPAILSMQLTRGVLEREPRYGEDWGWDVGVLHTVVIYGFTEDERVEIGDPGVGREFWSIQSVEDLWTGETTWLVPTGSADPTPEHN
ncbi:MAG: hypothetical protein AAGH92_01525 [Planctomycetota bacterium]